MSTTAVPLPDDEVFETELRRLAALADPVPGAWRVAAEASVAWLALEGEPADLAYDSVSARDRPLDGTRLRAVTMRELRFTCRGLVIDLELDAGSERLRLTGRLAPARATEVTATWPEGERVVVADDRGTFHIDDLPRRPICLVVAGEEPAKTGWILP